jgi:hypothetical protein
MSEPTTEELTTAELEAEARRLALHFGLPGSRRFDDREDTAAVLTDIADRLASLAADLDARTRERDEAVRDRDAAIAAELERCANIAMNYAGRAGDRCDIASNSEDEAWCCAEQQAAANICNLILDRARLAQGGPTHG